MQEIPAWFIREVLPFEPVLMRYLRRNWRRKDDIPDSWNDGVTDPERTGAARDELRRLQHALEQLPPRAREVIFMRRVESFRQRAFWM